MKVRNMFMPATLTLLCVIAMAYILIDMHRNITFLKVWHYVQHVAFNTWIFETILAFGVIWVLLVYIDNDELIVPNIITAFFAIFAIWIKDKKPYVRRNQKYIIKGFNIGETDMGIVYENALDNEGRNLALVLTEKTQRGISKEFPKKVRDNMGELINEDAGQNLFRLEKNILFITYDVYTEDNKFVLRIEVPGIKLKIDNVSVSYLTSIQSNQLNSPLAYQQIELRDVLKRFDYFEGGKWYVQKITLTPKHRSYSETETSFDKDNLRLIRARIQ